VEKFSEPLMENILRGNCYLPGKIEKDEIATEKQRKTRHHWFMPLILTTWEDHVQGQPGTKFVRFPVSISSWVW
jgi:hypothetical protein